MTDEKRWWDPYSAGYCFKLHPVTKLFLKDMKYDWRRQMKLNRIWPFCYMNDKWVCKIYCDKWQTFYDVLLIFAAKAICMWWRTMMYFRYLKPKSNLYQVSCRIFKAHTLDTFILASKKFHTFWFTRVNSYFNVSSLGYSPL